MRVSRETRPPPRKQRAHMRWWRCYSEFARHPKWRLVAAIAEVSVSDVIAIVVDILGAANRGRPRGSVNEFSVLECGAALNIRPDIIRSVVAALEELGWIDQDYVATWDERQPDREDPTAGQRQQRRRERIKEQRASAPSVMSSVTSGVTPRDITPRGEENLLLKGDSEAGNAPTPPDEAPQKGLSGKEVDWKAEAETDGLATIMRRRQVDRKAAKAILTRWLIALRFDHEQLCIMLGEAELRDLKGRAFEDVIGAWINEKHTRVARQQSLPLGPTAVGGRTA